MKTRGCLTSLDAAERNFFLLVHDLSNLGISFSTEKGLEIRSQKKGAVARLLHKIKMVLAKKQVTKKNLELSKSSCLTRQQVRRDV